MLRGQLLTHSVSGSAREVATYGIKPAEPALSDIFGGEGQSVRSSTSAVASRLYQQETVQLDYNTPMTMDSAKEDSEQARIITDSKYPYKIVFANPAWEQLCGFKQEEVLGYPGLGFMQGNGTDLRTVQKINSAVREAGRAKVVLLNYKKDGSAFYNRLQISPLRSNMGDITHMLGILREVPE